MIAHLAIGFFSGLLVGLAIFSHAFSRAVVTGLITGAMVGAMMVDGVEGYVRWATYLPAEMSKFSWFWTGMLGGILSGARVWLMWRVP